MNGMILPAANSYFAIYTLESGIDSPDSGRNGHGLFWDLHATSTDRAMAISHARMLALQPGVSEVHVKEVVEDGGRGIVSVRDIKRCKRGVQRFEKQLAAVAAFVAAALLALAFFA